MQEEQGEQVEKAGEGKGSRLKGKRRWRETQGRGRGGLAHGSCLAAPLVAWRPIWWHQEMLSLPLLPLADSHPGPPFPHR